jgi:hypothetical protein
MRAALTRTSESDDAAEARRATRRNVTCNSLVRRIVDAQTRVVQVTVVTEDATGHGRATEAARTSESADVIAAHRAIRRNVTRATHLYFCSIHSPRSYAWYPSADADAFSARIIFGHSSSRAARSRSNSCARSFCSRMPPRRVPDDARRRGTVSRQRDGRTVSGLV